MLLTNKPKVKSYCYLNQTSFWEILKINEPEFNFEKAVPAGETVCFQAFDESIVEILSPEFPTAHLTKKIRCKFFASSN